MRTVAFLKAELAKFPDDAVCFAYSGEVTGIIIERAPRGLEKQGVIHCSEGDDEDRQTELLEPTPVT